MPSVLIFLVNSVGATLAGIPLTTISKSYDWGGVFVVLELACLFCGCLLLGARNVSRHMIDPSKFEWRFYTKKETWLKGPNIMFNIIFKSFTLGVKTWQNLMEKCLIFLSFLEMQSLFFTMSLVSTGIFKRQIQCKYLRFEHILWCHLVALIMITYRKFNFPKAILLLPVSYF